MAHLRRVATSSRHHDYSDRESGNGDDSYGSDQDEDTRGTEARGVGPGRSRGRVRQGRDTPAPSPASHARNARTADTDTEHDAYSDQEHESDAGPSRPRKRPRVTYGSPDDEIVVDFEETEAEFDSYESESCSSESDSGSEYEEPTTLRRRNRGRQRGRPRHRRSTASSDEEEDGQSNGAANTSASSTNTSRATEQPPINRRQSPIPGAHPTHNPNPSRQTGLTHVPADSASTVTVAPVIKGRPKPFLIGLTTQEVNEVLQHPSRQQRRIARLVSTCAVMGGGGGDLVVRSQTHTDIRSNFDVTSASGSCRLRSAAKRVSRRRPRALSGRTPSTRSTPRGAGRVSRATTASVALQAS